MTVKRRQSAAQIAQSLRTYQWVVIQNARSFSDLVDAGLITQDLVDEIGRRVLGVDYSPRGYGYGNERDNFEEWLGGPR